MLYKCRHNIVVAEKYCPDCNKKPVITSPGQSLGNRRPNIMKMDKP